MDIGANEHSGQIFSVPISPRVHLPQSANLPPVVICPSAHLPRCSFALVPLFSKCSLAPNRLVSCYISSIHLDLTFIKNLKAYYVTSINKQN